MNETLSISSSNISAINNISNNKFRPFSSKLKETKKLSRILSAGNIFNTKLSSYYNLPSLNNNNNNNPIKLKTKYKNKSISNKGKNKYRIEIERLYEQNYQYKKVIKKLQFELKCIKNEIQKKDDILNQRNEEIESIITENEEKNINVNINSYIPFTERAKYTLIKKMKNQLKETEQELNNEINKNLKLKKNNKYTKYNELIIENKILNEHKEKILTLIQNSKELQDNIKNELIQKAKYNDNIESQIQIINNYGRKYKELEEEENFLKNEIIKYENILINKSNKVKIIKLKQLSLKNQNMKLKTEQKDYIDKYQNDKNSSMENLKKELSKAQRDYNYNRIKHKKSFKKLINIRNTFSSSFKNDKNLQNKYFLLKNNEKELSLKKSIKIDNINEYEKKDEEYVNNLKKIYQENREKENDLEQGLFLFQQAIKRNNNGENINLTEIKENILKSINNKNYKIDTNNINNNI